MESIHSPFAVRISGGKSTEDYSPPSVKELFRACSLFYSDIQVKCLAAGDDSNTVQYIPLWDLKLNTLW